MTTVNSLYELFSLSPDCTDDELRRAYHRAVLQHHPDLNPHESKNATAETQHLTTTYATLKKFRKHGVEPLNFDAEVDLTATSGPEVWISFDFSSVDIKDIARRKKSFRQACEAFRQNPSDVLRALRLINAAFEAERQDVIDDLLRNPILVDAASLLLSSVDSLSACETLNRWAEFLYENHLVKEGIQILEDAFSSGKAPNEVEELLKEELRSMHYGFAQGYTSRTRRKPAPAVRIEHFNRILELGFKYGYIYKVLAEAYHELGDDTKARKYLQQAYKIDPELTGAVKISRALGLLPVEKKAVSSVKKKRREYEYTRPDEIPSPNQIREWAATGKWSEIIAFADYTKYSRRVLPKSRNTLHQIARSLGDCDDSQARKALINMLNYGYYSEVSDASIVSLSKIGDEDTIHTLRNVTTYSTNYEIFLKSAISYLEARLESKSTAEFSLTTEEVIEHAKHLFDKGDYGTTRALLEHIIKKIPIDGPLYYDVIILLAMACGNMHDAPESVSLIKPIIDKLPDKYRLQIETELAHWLMERFFVEPYDPSKDEDYLLAFEIHLDVALTSNNPDGVLESLYHLTRYMEKLNEREMVQWLSTLIRSEAPGTGYAKGVSNLQYTGVPDNLILSETLKSRLATIQDRIKKEIPNKLSQVLKSPYAFKGSTHRRHA